MFENRIEELNEKNEAVLMEKSDDKRTYTVDEIQDILGISRPTAYNLVKKNVFHSVRVGGHIRISKRSFDNWLDHQMQICQRCHIGFRQTSKKDKRSVL